MKLSLRDSVADGKNCRFVHVIMEFKISISTDQWLVVTMLPHTHTNTTKPQPAPGPRRSLRVRFGRSMAGNCFLIHGEGNQVRGRVPLSLIREFSAAPLRSR